MEVIGAVSERKALSPADLEALLQLHSDSKSREFLAGYVSLALGMLAEAPEDLSLLGLASQITELGRKGIVWIPAWVTGILERAATRSLDSSETSPELAVALLTLHAVNGDPSLESRAQGIINRCNRAAFDGSLAPEIRIHLLHTAVTCCDYVSGFSVRKAASLWRSLADIVLAPSFRPSTRLLFRLLETARELSPYADIPAAQTTALFRLLKGRAAFGSPEARAYAKIIEPKPKRYITT